MRLSELASRLARGFALENPSRAASAPWLSAALLTGLLGACLALARPALSLPYLTDDMDLLLQFARLRSGELSWLSYLSHGHNEHRIPLLRLLYFWTEVGNFNAIPLRLAVLGIYAVCAWLGARLTCRYWGPWPSVAVGVVAVSAVGFSSMPLWVPSTVIFSLSAAFMLAACDLLSSPGKWRLGLATLSLVLAGLSMNASVLCVPILILAFWQRLGRGPRERFIVAGIWLAIAVCILVWSIVQMKEDDTTAGMERLIAAARNATFLATAAPYRWLMVWSTGAGGAVPGWWTVGAGFVIWIAMHFAVPGTLRRLIIMLSASAAVIAAAVGYGRSDFPLSELYLTDRYFYWFLVPLAMITVAVVCQLLPVSRHRLACGGIVLLALAGGWLQSTRSLAPLHGYPWIRTTMTGVESAKRLAVILAASGQEAPIEIENDAFIPIDGLHKGGLTFRTLSYAMNPHGIPGLQFAASANGASDARLNDVLRRWAQAEGWPAPPFLAVLGKMKPLLLPCIDFARSGSAQQIVSGFHDWDGEGRWMDVRGIAELSRSDESSVHIQAFTPRSLLLAALPPETSFTVKVSANGKPIGTLKFADGDTADVTFPLPPAAGDRVRITMESAFSWKGRDAYPGNNDPRTLTVRLLRIELTDAVDAK